MASRRRLCAAAQPLAVHLPRPQRLRKRRRGEMDGDREIERKRERERQREWGGKKDAGAGMVDSGERENLQRGPPPPPLPPLGGTRLLVARRGAPVTPWCSLLLPVSPRFIDDQQRRYRRRRHRRRRRHPFDAAATATVANDAPRCRRQK